LCYEIISDLLIQNPDKKIIFIDILNGYDVEKQALIFNKHCNEKNIKFATKQLDRIKVMRVIDNQNFHTLITELGTVIDKVKNTCLVVLDTLTFFYQDSYGFKVFGRGITRKDFVKHYLRNFNTVAIEKGVTILFTLPEHLLRENNTHDLIKKSNNEEKVIYEHIKQKVDKKKSFSVSNTNVEKFPSNSLGHKSDSEIDNVKPDMYDKLLDKSEIEAGISIILSNVAHNRFKLTIYKSEESEKEQNEFCYSIDEDGLEFCEKIKMKKN
jgi:hypothetical protein